VTLASKIQVIGAVFLSLDHPCSRESAKADCQRIAFLAGVIKPVLSNPAVIKPGLPTLFPCVRTEQRALA
jgi:hypothetical protein